MKFTKMHGLGNDYIYVDLFQEHVPDAPRLARAVSDRHFGIGSDGLILVGPPSEQEADLRMRIFNADGSEAAMCGNGIRCVARFAVERGLCVSNPLRVQTGNGVLGVTWRRTTDGAFHASVHMGTPRFACGDIPACVPGVPAHQSMLSYSLPENFWKDLQGPHDWMAESGVESTLSLVNVGNAHAVAWCADVAKIPLETIGPRLERYSWFPDRINVHVAQVIGPSAIRMRTWERGSGITLACGTGASAVGVAAMAQQRVRGPLVVHLPGGALDIAWDGEGHTVVMSGPATLVGEGTLAPHLAAEAG